MNYPVQFNHSSPMQGINNKNTISTTKINKLNLKRLYANNTIKYKRRNR